MTEKVVGADKDKGLNELRQWVRTNEAAWGPIFKIGNDGEKTAASFHWNEPEHPKPSVKAKIKLSLSGNAPAGTTKLCDGWPFLSGTLQHVVVYREEA